MAESLRTSPREQAAPGEVSGEDLNGQGPDAQGEYETYVVAVPDIAGRLVGKRLTARHYRAAAYRGVRTCNVVFGWGLGHELLDGFSTVGWDHGYGDFIARPDPHTMRPLAWWPKTAGVIADAVWPDGAAVAVSPRHVLREQVRHAESLGLRPVIASELEFTLFDETAASLETKGYTSLDLHGVQLHPELVEAIGPDEDLLGTIRRDLEASAIPVESLKSEYSRGQFEIALGPGEALESADRHVLYKLAVREISRRAGVAATFMPKWHEGFGGSSCHLHVSLNGADGRNVFGEEAASGGALESFIGGVQHHARDVFLLWAPYVNSYKRFRRGSFAPSSLSWGEDNRTAALRVTGQGAGRHLENRLPGADVNPYLAYAGLLAAGLSGIEQGMQPGHAVDHSNAYQRDDLPALPASVPEAVEAFATSDFTRASFGDEAVDHISNFANKEFEASQAAVTDWERRRFFDL